MHTEGQSLIETLTSLARLEHPMLHPVEAVLETKFVSREHYASWIELQAEPTPQFSEIEMTLRPDGRGSLVCHLPKGNNVSAKELLWVNPFGPNIRRLTEPRTGADFLSYRLGTVEIGIEVFKDDSVRVVRVDWPTRRNGN